MTKHLIEDILKQSKLGTLSATEQLNICRRKIKNYRQTESLNTLIALYVQEPLVVKLNKVNLNINAMLHFASLSDKQLSNFLAIDLKESYEKAFNHFIGYHHEIYSETLEDLKVDRFRLSDLIANRTVPFTTTVEVNGFIDMIINDNLERVNGLPASRVLKETLVSHGKISGDSQPYNNTDLRELSILYFVSLSKEDKTAATNAISSKYGFLLNRLK